MQWEEFTKQMNRITSTFGKNAYGDERVQLFWRELQDFDARWFERVIDRFIGESRLPPLMPEFGEEIGKERERLWRLEKRERERDAKAFWEGTYQPDDVMNICQNIKKRMRGEMTDQDFSSFTKHLGEATKSNPKVVPMLSCKYCEDGGLVFRRDESGYEFAYRCFCSSGQSKPKSYLLFQREFLNETRRDGS